MPRAYRKQNTEYWASRSASPAPQQSNPAAGANEIPLRPSPMPDVVYGSTEVRTEIARASNMSGGAPMTLAREPMLNDPGPDAGAFQNLKALGSTLVGYSDDRGGAGYVGCSTAVDLCVKAWASVPVVRNAIEVNVEFSSQPLWVKSSNETVRTFFTEWLRITQMQRFVTQFMRGRYREGQNFIWAFHGQFSAAHYGHFHSAFGSKANKIPIRYELLNPSAVFAPAGISYPYTYTRLLSTWECERLRNPITEQDKQVFRDLPPIAQQQIMNGAANTLGIYLPLDPTRLRFAFYKKQDFEPFAVPFAWPVLPSIEWKLTLTKMDKQMARLTERAILLITNGEAPSKENGGNGINQNNMARLQKIVNNPAALRCLVADYTTTGTWLVPPIQEILGPAKYQVVNEDIKEGLQSVLTGDDKFANAQIKAKIFLQRLEEGQDSFLEDFLMPEVRSICETMGFRTIPEIGFQKIDLQDETVMARIYAQLVQIGALTPEQGIKAMQTQILPDKDELVAGQAETKKLRDKGLFEPLVGGQKDDGSGPNGRPSGTGGGKQSGTRKSSPMGTSKASVMDAISMKTFGECMREVSKLESDVEKMLRKSYAIKGAFNSKQTTAVQNLVQKIINTEPREKWFTSMASVAEKWPKVPEETQQELQRIQDTYQIDAGSAAIWRHCWTEAPAEAA